MICLCSLSKKWNYQKTMSINPQSMHIATILTNTRSIIKKSMLIATDFLWVGFSSPKTFNLQSMPPNLSFCVKPNGEVAESIIQRITLVLRERGDHRRLWVRAGEEHFPLPLIRFKGIFSSGRRLFFAKRGSGFCNSGQALRAE